MLRKMLLGLAGVVLLICVSGCSEDSSGPNPTDTEREGDLNSGFWEVEWQLTDHPCPGENYCITHLRANKGHGKTAAITIILEGDLGAVEQSTDMSDEDFTAFFELIEGTVWEAIRERDGEHSACDDNLEYYERISMFSGDAGFAAFIQGCNDPGAVEIRETVRQLAAEYFPADVLK